MHQHLKQSDRACIAALLRKQYSYSAIARILEVYPSSVSREVRRNSCGNYRVHHAQRCAKDRRANARVAYRTIDTNERLEDQVIHGLKQDWSPDQIVERCNISSVSSIYRYLERHPNLKRYLRRGGKRRRKYGTKRIPSRYQANKRSIHERPTINTIGHWEGDTVLGSERKLRIVTYVDKVSGYLIAAKTPGGADAIHAQARDLDNHLKRTTPCLNGLWWYENGRN